VRASGWVGPVALSKAFVAVDSNWASSREVYAALAAHIPGVLVEAREWSQAWRAGWLRSGQLRLQRLNQVLWCKRYALPMGWFHSLNRASMPLLARSIARQSVGALGELPRVWIFSSPYYLRIVETVQPALAVYHPVDDYRWYWPRRAAHTARLEAAILARADLVVCVSRYNQARLRQLCRDNPEKVVHVPNGAPERFFREPANDSVYRWHAHLANFPRPYFAYVGDPAVRVDFGMIEALAAAGTGTILFAGPTQLPKPLAQHQNIRAIGPIPEVEVPAFLRAVDVLLVPQEDSEFNRATSPRKLWEYCASGKPIVGACLTEVNPSTDGIRVATSAANFVLQAQDVAAGGDTVVERTARKRLAETHAYPVLARRLLEHLCATGPAFSGGHVGKRPGGAGSPGSGVAAFSGRDAGSSS
jgi:glycosyltransferase involved in cell wall biosynthesis